jgi:hypothetical protein
LRAADPVEAADELEDGTHPSWCLCRSHQPREYILEVKGPPGPDALSAVFLAGGGCAKSTAGLVRLVFRCQYSNAPLPAL